LVLEQLFLLRQETGARSHRFDPLTSIEENVKSPTLLKTGRQGHPKFKFKGWSTPSELRSAF